MLNNRLFASCTKSFMTASEESTSKRCRTSPHATMCAKVLPFSLQAQPVQARAGLDARIGRDLVMLDEICSAAPVSIHTPA